MELVHRSSYGLRACAALATVLLVLLAPPTAGAADSETKAFKLATQGQKLARKGKFPEAIAKCERAVEITERQWFPALIHLATMRLALHSYRKAYETALEAAALSPSTQERAAALTLAGRAYEAAGYALAANLTNPAGVDEASDLHRAAVSNLEQAIEISPQTTSDALFHLASLLPERGHDDRRSKLLESYLRLAPNGIHLVEVGRALGYEYQTDRSDGGKENRRGSRKKSGPTLAPPIKIYFPRLKYPESLKGQGIAGTTVIRGIVERSGTIGKLEVLEPLHPEFDRLAMETVGQWRFLPARLLNGEAVSVYYTLSVNYVAE